jgi:hypothetical protein
VAVGEWPPLRCAQPGALAEGHRAPGDGLGIGPAPDTDAYGDTGSNTLGNLATAATKLDPHVVMKIMESEDAPGAGTLVEVSSRAIGPRF